MLAALTYHQPSIADTFRKIGSDAETGRRAWQDKVSSNQRFFIRRVVRRNNSFRPMIRGRIEAFGNGSCITVSMHMPLVDMLILVTCEIFFLLAIPAPSMSILGYLLLACIPVAMIAFFFPQAYHAKQLLIEQLSTSAV